MPPALRPAAPYAIVIAVAYFVVPLLIYLLTSSANQGAMQLFWLVYGLPTVTFATGIVAGYRLGVSWPLPVLAAALFLFTLLAFYTIAALPFAAVLGVTTVVGELVGRAVGRGRQRPA
jgi:hypothetical protein